MNLVDQNNQRKKAIKRAIPGQVYVRNDKGNVEFKNLSDVLVDENVTFKEVIENHYNQTESLKQQFIVCVESVKFALSHILKINGYKHTFNTIDELLEEVGKMQIINPNKSYIACKEENGYITSISECDSIIENLDIPKDIVNQCYYLENGKQVLDIEKLNNMIFGGE